MILTDDLFFKLIHAASLAPSADNMQPWEFRKRGNEIEVFVAKPRILPTDVVEMFAWIGVGAAIQNIVVAASAYGLVAAVEYNPMGNAFELAATIHFSEGNCGDQLADCIRKRTTNRCPFSPEPLSEAVLSELKESIRGLDAHVYFTQKPDDYALLAQMDARSSYIRLSHKPLHDELFSILRFTRREFERTRFGLTFESLEVPRFAVAFARLLQFWSVNKLVGRLGFDRLVARQLSVKLKKAGAICLLTSNAQSPVGYMEAGRAIEQLWLAATCEGLSVQPYGVLPQYLTKTNVEPETFLSNYVEAIERNREPFYTIFAGAKGEFPALVLRLGRAGKQSARSEVRLQTDQLIR
jgi:hypothetical protein